MGGGFPEAWTSSELEFGGGAPGVLSAEPRRSTTALCQWTRRFVCVCVCMCWQFVARAKGFRISYLEARSDIYLGTYK